MKAYTKEQIEKFMNEICNRISKGESLRSVLRDDDMPDRTTFFKWIDSNKEYINQYARATELRADYIFDEMFEIADDGQNDYIEKVTNDGESYTVLNSEHVQRSKLRIDARKWALAKMNPKKYGDKLDLNHSGEMEIVTMTPEQRQKRIDELKAKLNAE